MQNNDDDLPRLVYDMTRPIHLAIHKPSGRKAVVDLSPLQLLFSALQ